MGRYYLETILIFAFDMEVLWCVDLRLVDENVKIFLFYVLKLEP